MARPEFVSWIRHERARENSEALSTFIEPELRPALMALRAAGLKQSRLTIMVRRAWSEGSWGGVLQQVTPDLARFSGYAIPKYFDNAAIRVTVSGREIADLRVGLPSHIDMSIFPEEDRHFGMTFDLPGFNIRENQARTEIAVALGDPWDRPDPFRSVWVGPSYGDLPDNANLKRIGVHSGEVESYLMHGATFIYKMELVLKQLGVGGWADVGPILDWGCGCSRMLRFLDPSLHDRIVGADIDGINIAWNQAHMPGPSFVHLALDPPTPFDDAQFGLVYGNSVFSHLNVADQFAWLAELQRITRPGGIVAVTIHGQLSWVFTGWHEAEPTYRRFVDGIVVADSLNPDIADVDGNRYTDTSHSHHYIKDRWSQYFDVISILENFSGTQALVLLRRR